MKERRLPLHAGIGKKRISLMQIQKNYILLGFNRQPRMNAGEWKMRSGEVWHHEK